jgi:ribonucleoside-diphosphate reductase alpha chain
MLKIEECGYEDVYDFTVPNTSNFYINDILVHNCGEIFLRSNQFCNLTEVVIRSEDTLEMLLKKVEVATILGTFQSTLTDFRYLRSIWKKNTEEERLLGVSLTGIMDHPVMSGKQDKEELKRWLKALREKAIEVNDKWADMLGIEQSVALSTIKPSGTVSQLVDASSGIHPRYSEYYVRTVRNDKRDPLSQFLVEQGVPCEPDVTKADSTWVFSFPVKSPETSVTAKDLGALEQLELYLLYSEHWADHNISITVYLREDEWLKVGAFVYEHFDDINGISFLPYSDHVYRQAPYQPISKEKYEELMTTMKKIDWSQFNVSEHEDLTAGIKEYACAGGACEIV